jgi:hypothetical protein
MQKLVAYLMLYFCIVFETSVKIRFQQSCIKAYQCIYPFSNNLNFFKFTFSWMDPSFVSVGFCVKFFRITCFLSQAISEKDKKSKKRWHLLFKCHLMNWLTIFVINDRH